jgi:predicted aspartyl protease
VEKYGFVQRGLPAAPQIEVTIFLPAESRIAKVTAVVDSGSGRTCVPKACLARLGEKLDHSFYMCIGAVGQPTRTPVYTVNLKIGKLVFEDVQVVAIDRDYALIGRDILNNLRIDLDGPGQQWSFDQRED